MSGTLAELEHQARRLSPEDRARLADSMLESLRQPVADIEQEWHRELQRRAAAYESGLEPAEPAEDVFAEARRIAR